MLVTGIGNGVPYPDMHVDRGSVKTQSHPVPLPGPEFTVKLPGGGDAEDIKRQAADLERITLAFNRKLQFIVDHETNQILVKVIDPETDKVIKILPPEELQRLNHKIRETIGFLFDETV